MLWPLPTGQTNLSKTLLHLLPGDISIAAGTANFPINNPKVESMIEEMRQIFREYLYRMNPNYDPMDNKNPFPSLHSANATVRVVLNIKDQGNATLPTLETDESYTLEIKDTPNHDKQVIFFKTERFSLILDKS